MKKEMNTNFFRKTSLIKKITFPRKVKSKSNMNNKGQITIFIILAILILIVLFLLFRGGSLNTVFVSKSPVVQIQDCVSENTQKALDILVNQGGSINPEFYYMYNGNKLEYLCYTEEFYKPCIVQKPLLRQSIEKEITDYIKPAVVSCVQSVKSNLEKEGYSVTTGEIKPEINILPGTILIDLKSDLTITKDTTESYKSIKTSIKSNLYDLIMIASSITQLEGKYGDSESLVYMVSNPGIKVEKIKRGDGTTVYILTDIKSLDKFQFASRGLVLPAGYTNI
ncbi:MAG: hypothetical protein WC438_00855 [Candidatus Pacearchaeota archaeon]